MNSDTLHVSQERTGLTRGDYDDRLVRHLYDTHCVHAKLSSSPDFDAIEFAERLSNLVSLTIERDVDTYGRRYEVFAGSPYKSSTASLAMFAIMTCEFGTSNSARP
ncbi:MAG: hypothetical protein ACP5HZ_10990 [Ferrimicrobium sp.]